MAERARVPRDPEKDYTDETGRARAGAFVREQTGADLEHVGSYSLDPGRCPATSRTSSASRRCRSASPARCASTASTRRASSTCRWRRPRARSSPATTAACGCSPRAAASRRRWSSDHMQRAPVFIFDDALRGARVRRTGSTSIEAEIRAAAESTTRSGQAHVHRPVPDRAAALPALQLHDRRRRRPEHDRQGDARRLRVDQGELPGRRRTTSCPGNIDTDKKHSRINMLLTRGKRVVAEAMIKSDVLKQLDGRRTPRSCSGHRQISTGRRLPRRLGEQRRARRQRAHRAVHRHRPGRGERLRVARRHHLHAAARQRRLLLVDHAARADRRAPTAAAPACPPRRECLEMLGCYGKGKADKFAEICAAVVLAGDTSLTCADPRRRLGVEPRPPRPQPALTQPPSPLTDGSGTMCR